MNKIFKILVVTSVMVLGYGSLVFAHFGIYSISYWGYSDFWAPLWGDHLFWF